MINKIKNACKKIQEQVEAMKEVQNIFRLVGVLKTFKFNDINVSIHYDPTYLKATGYSVAACVVTGKDRIVIPVDDTFKALDEEIQNTIILHEIGHYINEDFKHNSFITNIKRSIGITFFNICDTKELKADQFAIENGSGKAAMTRTLNMMKELLSENKTAVKEINVRLAAIS